MPGAQGGPTNTALPSIRPASKSLPIYQTVVSRSRARSRVELSACGRQRTHARSPPYPLPRPPCRIHRKHSCPRLFVALSCAVLRYSSAACAACRGRLVSGPDAPGDAEAELAVGRRCRCCRRPQRRPSGCKWPLPRGALRFSALLCCRWDGNTGWNGRGRGGDVLRRALCLDIRSHATIAWPAPAPALRREATSRTLPCSAVTSPLHHVRLCLVAAILPLPLPLVSVHHLCTLSSIPSWESWPCP